MALGDAFLQNLNRKSSTQSDEENKTPKNAPVQKPQSNMRRNTTMGLGEAFMQKVDRKSGIEKDEGVNV